jgi:hypothetical protein
MLNSTESRTGLWEVLLVLTGSLAGFLVHNWPPAKIFMGDTGSYFIGLMLASTTVLGTYYDYTEDAARRHVILAPLCILAVPLYDFCSVMLIRLLEGRSPFHADKSHFSHRLVELGLKPRHAVLTIHLATLTTGLGALLLYRVSDWSGALLIVAHLLRAGDCGDSRDSRQACEWRWKWWREKAVTRASEYFRSKVPLPAPRGEGNISRRPILHT